MRETERGRGGGGVKREGLEKERSKAKPGGWMRNGVGKGVARRKGGEEGRRAEVEK